MKSIVLLMLLGVICAFTGFAGTPVYTEGADACKNCVYANAKAQNLTGFDSAAIIKIIAVMAMIVLATLYSWRAYRKKIYIVIGCAVIFLIGGSYVYSHSQTNSSPKRYVVNCSLPGSAKSSGTDEFHLAGSEFKNSGISDSLKTIDTTGGVSEFSANLDEFSEQAPADATPILANPENGLLYQVIVLLLFSALIGLIIKYPVVRRLRGVIMLASIVYLGFVKGACPCMIMSLQNTILFLLGNPVTFIAMLWFLGLIIVTYFFGKTWCGWLCHLGGLQEFLFRNNGRRVLVSAKSQIIIKYIQIGLFATLLIQLAITRSNLWVKYDPFKVAFNLVSANTVGYILLALLLPSSVLVYRPFCRIACPVGLILGWVTKIPGARKLKVAVSCNECKSCTRSCRQNALHACETGGIVIKGEDCILCGECLDKCKKDSLTIWNK